MTADPIPFNRPTTVGDEFAYISEAIEIGHSSSGGPFTRRASAILQEVCEARDVLLTTSCTDALEMSAMLLGIGPGDVVIVPSFTFTSTALAFAREGAQLRFCDIDPITLALDPADVEAAMDDRVRAVVTVHYAGVPGDIGGLVDVCCRHDVDLIEDNAHGLFATLDGRPLGSFGRLTTLSFHETKNFVCGEGGALVVNDERDIDAAHILLDKGTNRRQYLEGAVDKYSWQGLGSSFGLSDLLAAFLVAQLESADHIRAERRRVAETYRELLTPVAEQCGVRLPYEAPGATPADHMFYVLLPHGRRADVLDRMRAEGVQATFHYVPLHSAPAGRQFSDGWRECPVTDDVSGRLLRLPFFNTLTRSDIERIVESFIRSLRR